jgi:hypothetical protein
MGNGRLGTLDGNSALAPAVLIASINTTVFELRRHCDAGSVVNGQAVTTQRSLSRRLAPRPPFDGSARVDAVHEFGNVRASGWPRLMRSAPASYLSRRKQS